MSDSENRMKKVYSLIIFIALVFSINAQSNIRLNNYWSDLHSLNPASINDKYAAVLSMAVRKQWVGIQGAPSTIFASGTTYLENYCTQLGLSIIQDKIGYTSLSNINLSYGYAIMFKSNWQLHLGLAANYQSLLFDFSSMNLIDGTDVQAFLGLQSRKGFNTDIGVEVASDLFRIGVASQNLISLVLPQNTFQTNTNYLYAWYYQNSNSIVNFGGGICGIQYSNIYQLEFNVTSYFKSKMDNGLTNKSNLFDIGLFYRTQSELGMILGLNLSESIHVSYSYDYHFGSLSFGSFGTNEIKISYNLMRNSDCHCWY